MEAATGVAEANRVFRGFGRYGGSSRRPTYYPKPHPSTTAATATPGVAAVLVVEAVVTRREPQQCGAQQPGEHLRAP